MHTLHMYMPSEKLRMSDDTLHAKNPAFDILEDLLQQHARENLGGALGRQMVRNALRMMRNDHSDSDIDLAINVLRSKHQAGVLLLPLDVADLQKYNWFDGL